MNKTIPLIQAAALSALVLAGPAAVAQAWKLDCLNVGANLPEPLGNPEGHMLTVPQAICSVQGGPMDGAVVTQNAIWQLDAKGATMLSSDGVARKPGATAVYRNSAGTLTWVMQDGKPAGYTGSGKGTYVAATGSGAALAGKAFSWVVRATGPRSYTIESTVD